MKKLESLQGERFELSHPLRETGPEPVAFDQAPPPLQKVYLFL